MGVDSSAGCHSPLSTCSSTLLMPRSGAHATPATATVPAWTVEAGLGTSMREAVLIGPSLDQPSGTQYASKAWSVVSSMLVSHFVADTYPYRPGTIRRAG